MRGRRPNLVVLVLASVLALGAWCLAVAAGGVYTQTAHGDPVTGVARLPTEPRGDCAQCHDQHASRDGIPTAGPFPYLLFAPNDNMLCSGDSGCHVGTTISGVWPGATIYDASIHARDSAVVWPGPTPRARPFGDAGYCVNCHDPHGRADASGLIPSLVSVREQGSCLTCHDGSGPALTDVAAETAKPSRHPVTDLAGRHVAGEGADPAAFGMTNRHAECVDCHNPHAMETTGLPPRAPDPLPALQQVSRVAVTNRPPGFPPTFVWRGADDTGTVREYEVCFKCHSSWTTQAPGQPDLAVLFNSNNASFHPVEAVGRDSSIDPQSFVTPWGPFEQVYCGDCHGSDDDGAAAGPHGSIHDNLLRRPWVASPGARTMTADEICFACHRYDVYANAASPTRDQVQSRWNRPADNRGHSWHVERQQIPCYSCHDSHGSPNNDALLVFGRNPGLNNVLQSTNGGTCGPTCHGLETYRINYPR